MLVDVLAASIVNPALMSNSLLLHSCIMPSLRSVMTYHNEPCIWACISDTPRRPFMVKLHYLITVIQSWINGFLFSFQVCPPFLLYLTMTWWKVSSVFNYPSREIGYLNHHMMSNVTKHDICSPLPQIHWGVHLMMDHDHKQCTSQHCLGICGDWNTTPWKGN